MRKFIITRDINDHLKAGDILPRTHFCWMQNWDTGIQWINCIVKGVGFFKLDINDVKEVL